MIIEHVIALCRSFESESLAFWVDGGWGVDALLGRQTRSHSDLDLAVKHEDLSAFQSVMELQGYVRVLSSEGAEWNWVFRHTSGRTVDLHAFVLDQHGNGLLGDPANGEMYPAGAFEGLGRIGSTNVSCIAAPFVLGFRNGFEPRDVDYHDVNALCAQFGLALPCRFQAKQDKQSN